MTALLLVITLALAGATPPPTSAQPTTPTPAATPVLPPYVARTGQAGVYSIDRVKNPTAVCPTEMVSTDVINFMELAVRQQLPAEAHAEPFTVAICIERPVFTTMVCAVPASMWTLSWLDMPIRISDARMLGITETVIEIAPGMSQADKVAMVEALIGDPTTVGSMRSFQEIRKVTTCPK